MAVRPRALVVTAWFPYPADNGIRQRQSALIDGLGTRFDVDLVALVDEPVEGHKVAEALERCERVRVVIRRPFEPGSARSVAAFLHPLPRAVVMTDTPEMHDAIDELFRERQYAVVVAIEVHVARYAMHRTDAVRVLDDLELGSLQVQYTGAHGIARARHALRWYKASRFVRSLLRAYDLTTTVSEPDRVEAHEIDPQARIVVVPNAVDIANNPTGLATPVEGTMIYAGSPTFDLNLEAVQWFARHVLPKVGARAPDARLRVTGRYEPVVDALPKDPHIEYTGQLADVRPAIAGAAVSVVPLQRGAGTRLKVLESMALGTPVVSTPKGVEGLDLVPGKEVLVASTPSEFARAVLEVLDDPGRRAELAAAGRRAVEERYDWGPITESFVDEVERLMRARV
jgi:glycosyltransferase involved in cell wall biosynthesis